jgi:hypothetical protein
LIFSKNKSSKKYIRNYVFFYLPETNASWSLGNEKVISEDIEPVDVSTFAGHSPDLGNNIEG